jgi:ferredoxin
MNLQIAGFLGVDLGQEEKRVARLACAGGNNVARTHASYTGVDTCRAAALVSGGGKSCVWGCLGFGDCAEVCDFDAITMNRQHLPVVEAALCTACGDCVDICPRDLFSLHPVSHRLWVACSNPEAGEEAEADCRVLCNGCGRCVADAPEGLITLKDKLAVVDYSRNALASQLAIERCPTGAIVWLGDGDRAQKGKAATRIVRKEALPVG